MAKRPLVRGGGAARGKVVVEPLGLLRRHGHHLGAVELPDQGPERVAGILDRLRPLAVERHEVKVASDDPADGQIYLRLEAFNRVGCMRKRFVSRSAARAPAASPGRAFDVAAPAVSMGIGAKDLDGGHVSGSATCAPINASAVCGWARRSYSAHQAAAKACASSAAFT